MLSSRPLEEEEEETRHKTQQGTLLSISAMGTSRVFGHFGTTGCLHPKIVGDGKTKQ